MKTMSIYKDDGIFIVEIKSDLFIHVTKRTFESEEQFLQYLDGFKPIMSDYELEVSEELWALVINFLNIEK